MEKFVKLSANLYREVNAIRITHRYDKREKEYRVEAEPVHYDNGLFGKCFCRTYYEHDGDGIAYRVRIGRRSAKREEELDNYIKENYFDIATRYVQDIKRKLNITDDIQTVKED